MTSANTPSPLAGRSLGAAVVWGIVFGAIQAAAPLGFWWLDPATVYALSLTLIAAVYIGFAVADGRPRVIAVEAGIAGAFVLQEAAAGRRGAAGGRGCRAPGEASGSVVRFFVVRASRRGRSSTGMGSCSLVEERL